MLCGLRRVRAEGGSVNRADAYDLALARARRDIKAGKHPADAVREACDRYRSSITATAEARMVKQLRREKAA